MTTLILILRSLFTRQRPVAILFMSLMVMLFVSDGKQPMVDILGAASITALLIALPYVAESRRELPKYMVYLWWGVFATTAVSLVLSDDIGFSFYAAARILGAAAVYWVFFVYGSRDTIHAFGKWLLLFTFVTLLAAAAYTLLSYVPALRIAPKMSLLIGAYGHHAMINILLMTMPLVVWFWLNRGGIVPLSAFVILLVAVGLSFTRVGLALTLVYMLVAVFMHRGAPLFRRIATGIATVLFVGGVSFLMFTPFGQQLSSGITWMTAPKAEKRLTVTDPRLGFWKQGLEALLAKPLFGNGPGTFVLSSYRHADNPANGSWFAHNFVIETLAENGFVGGLAILAVITGAAALVFRNFRSPAAVVFWPTDGPIIAGIGLTLLYSLIDYNLSFLVVWYLLWALLGVMGGGMHEDGLATAAVPIHIRLAQVLLGVFAVVVAVGVTIGVVTRDVHLNALFLPYSESAVQAYLVDTDRKQKKLTETELEYFQFFHRRNQRVLFRLAKVSWAPDVQQRLLEHAWRLEPSNTSFLNAYMTWLAENDFQWDIGNILLSIASKYAPPEKSKQFAQMLPLTSEDMFWLYNLGLVRWVGVPADIRDYIGKAFYYLGMSIVEKNPEQAYYYWLWGGMISGRDSIIVESANLVTTVLHEEGFGRVLLEECIRKTKKQNQCTEEMKYFPEFRGYGEFERDIQSI